MGLKHSKFNEVAGNLFFFGGSISGINRNWWKSTSARGGKVRQRPRRGFPLARSEVSLKPFVPPPSNSLAVELSQRRPLVGRATCLFSSGLVHCRDCPSERTETETQRLKCQGPAASGPGDTARGLSGRECQDTEQTAARPAADEDATEGCATIWPDPNFFFFVAGATRLRAKCVKFEALTRRVIVTVNCRTIKIRPWLLKVVPLCRLRGPAQRTDNAEQTEDEAARELQHNSDSSLTGCDVGRANWTTVWLRASNCDDRCA